MSDEGAHCQEVAYGFELILPRSFFEQESTVAKQGVGTLRI